MKQKNNPWKDVPHSRPNALAFIHRYLAENDVRKKVVIDVSAGSGFIAGLWQEAGAEVRAYDMYPEMFHSDVLSCFPIDLNYKLPIESEVADYILLMETIEHIPDQLNLLNGLSRILKHDGILIITKPNNSNLSARMANVWVEAEKSNLFLSNEAAAVGYDNKKTYSGRVYLCNVQRLRTLAGLAELHYQEVYSNRLSVSAMLWYFILGGWLHLRSFMTYKKLSAETSNNRERNILLEQHKLNTNRIVLLHKHLCILFRKT